MTKFYSRNLQTAKVTLELIPQSLVDDSYMFTIKSADVFIAHSSINETQYQTVVDLLETIEYTDPYLEDLTFRKLTTIFNAKNIKEDFKQAGYINRQNYQISTVLQTNDIELVLVYDVNFDSTYGYFSFLSPDNLDYACLYLPKSLECEMTTLIKSIGHYGLVNDRIVLRKVCHLLGYDEEYSFQLNETGWLESVYK